MSLACNILVALAVETFRTTTAAAAAAAAAVVVVAGFLLLQLFLLLFLLFGCPIDARSIVVQICQCVRPSLG